MSRPTTKPILAALLAVCVFAMADQEKPQPNPAEAVKSRDAKVREAAMEKILDERRHIISTLNGIVQNDENYRSNRGSVVDAMKLLGALRATQSIDILVERLDFQEPEHFVHISTTTRSPLRNHYALFALVDIGKPSIPAVLREALDTDDMMTHIYAAGIIDKIEGTDMAVVYLRTLLEKETDEKKRARLQDIIKHVLRGPDRPL